MGNGMKYETEVRRIGKGFVNFLKPWLSSK